MVEQAGRTAYHGKNNDQAEEEVVYNDYFVVSRVSRYLLLEILLMPFSYLTQKGFDSKNASARMWRSFNHWLNVPKDKLSLVTSILERLYSAVLLYKYLLDRNSNYYFYQISDWTM
jgi:hypothetical protein